MTEYLGSLPGALAQGLVWGIMAVGVYITFRILDIADLTVDGTFCTGAAVCAVLITSGVNVWVALLLATIAGAAAGCITGFFHIVLGIPAILSAGPSTSRSCAARTYPCPRGSSRECCSRR